MGGTGKKKIEIKKITNNEKRFVTFCKRRKGMFKKVKELGVLTGCRIAAVVFSPAAEKPHTCGDTSVINQYVSDTCTCAELALRPESDVEAALKVHESKDLNEISDLNELTSMANELESIRETFLEKLNL